MLDKTCLSCESKLATKLVTMEFRGVEKGKDTFGVCASCAPEFQGLTFWQTHPTYEQLQVRYLVSN